MLILILILITFSDLILNDQLKNLNYPSLVGTADHAVSPCHVTRLYSPAYCFLPGIEGIPQNVTLPSGRCDTPTMSTLKTKEILKVSKKGTQSMGPKSSSFLLNLSM